ncbi:hypothetical protein ACF1BQ_033900 [Bradyrhizobium sp. RDT10]
MFVRLTRRKRAKAGWYAALLYLFCVLAPGVALALGDAASCLVHQLGTAASTHVHDAAQPEHAASHQHHEMQADQHAMHHADAGHAMDHGKSGHTKHQHDGKGAMGPCCAMQCVSAIAADLPAVEKPAPPISLCVSENFERLPDKAPPLLYRPPIA